MTKKSWCQKFGMVEVRVGYFTSDSATLDPMVKKVEPITSKEKANVHLAN